MTSSRPEDRDQSQADGGFCTSDIWTDMWMRFWKGESLSQIGDSTGLDLMNLDRQCLVSCPEPAKAGGWPGATERRGAAAVA